MTSGRQNGYSLESVDDETAALIVQLQIADTEELWSSQKGKSRPDAQTDTEIAILLQKQDLLDTLSVISDRRMTRSIASAVYTDGDLVTEATIAEDVAARDRELAHRLSGSSAEATSSVRPSPNIGNAVLAKLAGMYVSDTVGQGLFTPKNKVEASGSAASSSSYRGDGGRRKATHLRCEACQDEYPYFDIIEAPCNHGYCRVCLHELFDASLKDESLFPPRCCRQSITIESVDIFLTRDLKHRFEQRKIELSTPNRTYCSMSTCSAFIQPSRINADVGVCPVCDTETCVICKGAAHAGDCPHDTALQQLFDVADQNNWQRCYECRRLVELDIGCNHITCRCGAQFCYICGLRWRTCGCPQWDENRLLVRANQIVDRQPQAPPVQAPARQVEVGRAADMLRERHECEHDGWNFVRGSYQCEECYFQLPQYIFECRRCRLRACNRCRRNRL